MGGCRCQGVSDARLTSLRPPPPRAGRRRRRHRRRRQDAGGRRSRRPAESVTLVGSLQSELGCGGDWSPACDGNAIGDRRRGRHLVDHGRGAGRVVGVEGRPRRHVGPQLPDAANVPLVLGGPTRLTFSYDDMSHRVAVAPGRSARGRDRRRPRSSPARRLRDDLTRERFYFVMADRFENGDPTNDTGGIAGDRARPRLRPDAQGLLPRRRHRRPDRPQLDYIEGLGTTAIWMTPSFKNRPVQGSGDPFISAGYHGYWITDFTQIDPHLGTNDELRQLVDEAHARGIKVFFDIITNHTADVIDYAEGPERLRLHRQGDRALPRRRRQRVRRPRLRRRAGTFPPLDPGDVVPVHAGVPDRGGRDGEGAGLAQRPDLLPQPRRHRRSPARMPSTATSSASTTSSPSIPTSSTG